MSPLEHPGTPGPREERGSAAGSHLHPPHVAGTEADSPVQQAAASPGAIPSMPANASGHDKMPPGRGGHTQDDSSAYEGRREEDKSHEPGDA